MPPKAKPLLAKLAAASKAAASKAGTATAPSPAPTPDVGGRDTENEPLPIYEAEARVNFLEEEDWSDLASVDSPSEEVAKVFEALLVLLGDVHPSSWAAAKAAVAEPQVLVRELKALGPCGSSEDQVAKAREALKIADLGRLRKPAAAAPAASARAKAPAKAGPAAAVMAKAKAKAAEASSGLAVGSLPQGAAAALAIGQLVEAVLAARESEKPQAFPMVWPLVPYLQLHSRLQQAHRGRQNACVVCPSIRSAGAVALHCQQSGALLYDLKQMQVRVHLCKTLTLEAARADIGKLLKDAMTRGLRLVLLLGDAPPNLRRYCDSKQVPMEAFDFEKLGEAATSLGLACPAPGFHLILLAQLVKEKSERILPQLVPCWDEMAVLVLDDGSLPAASALQAEAEQSPTPCLRSALRLLALQAASAPASKAPEEASAVSEARSTPLPQDMEAVINEEEFEYSETFGDDWDQRWQSGPAINDESGKAIRQGLITTKLIKYPPNPKDAKQCLQLMGGAPNSPCTGIWTSFSPLIRPTEVEFEFTMNGRVDLPNACVVFTEKPFEGALPDCKVGVQFTVRGGMQLCGGGGNLVRISNDGKIQNDKWNKVIMQIDWVEKVVVAQVDTRGKGYAAAIQTVPFRDASCEGFGCLFIYNTDTQATCWFHSLRVKQGQMKEMDTEALDARRQMAENLKKKEYQRAVDADMAVGMKMGAIQSVKQHGLNLAQEQAANNKFT